MKLKAGAADVDAEAAKAGGGLEPGGLGVPDFSVSLARFLLDFFGFSYFYLK